MSIYDSHLYKYLKGYIENDDIIKVSIFGLEGRGKTNVAKWLVKEFEPTEAIYVNVNMLKNFFDDLYIFLKDYRAKTEKFALILDDISFTALQYSENVKKVLRWLSTIRHRVKAEKYMTVAVMHYPFSSLPYLRETPAKIIMYVDYSYYKAFKNEIPKRYLNRFRELQAEAFLKGKKGLALVSAIGFHDITTFPLVTDNVWNDITPEVSGLFVEEEGVRVEVAVKEKGLTYEVKGRTIYFRRYYDKGKMPIIAHVRIKSNIPIVDEYTKEILYDPEEAKLEEVEAVE